MKTVEILRRMFVKPKACHEVNFHLITSLQSILHVTVRNFQSYLAGILILYLL